MSEPIVNLEEHIGKTVGRRRPPADCFATGMAVQRTGGQLAKTFGVHALPKGAFKFHSHEEADAWLMKNLTRPKAS
jgi:hypothetical protein